jgi:hypothetical protein
VSGASGASGVWGPVSGARPARARTPPPQDHEGISESSLREHEEVTKVKNVNILELGRHAMNTWYFSPFPKEYFPEGHIDRLYCCEFTLKFFRRKVLR